MPSSFAPSLLPCLALPLSHPPSHRSPNHFAVNVRVVQRNLVYVIGLSPAIADEAVLRSSNFFGQYGPISKIMVNKSHLVNSPKKSAKNSSAAYITYKDAADAQAAIECVDTFEYDGRLIRARCVVPILQDSSNTI